MCIVLLTSVAPSLQLVSMMDAFADALAFPDEVDVPVVGPKPLTSSQNIATSEQLEEDDPFETEAWDAEAIGDSHSQDDADNSIVHRPACRIASKKRPPVEPTSSNKKPRYKESSTMKVNSLEGNDLVHVPCVFVDHDHGKKGGILRVPIPLWNQCTVVWGAYDFGTIPWIVVGTQEMWMKRLVDMVQKKPVRHWAKHFQKRFAREFKDSLREARGPEVALLDLFDESPVICNNSQSATVTKRLRTDRENSRVIKIKIGEFGLTCVNTHVRCLLRLDSATKRFIASWVAPLMKAMTLELPIEELGETDEAPGSLQRGSSSESLGAAITFKMPENATPNHREKVWWDPPKHAWKVSVKTPVGIPSRVAEPGTKSTQLCTKYFSVSASHDPKQYEAQKVAEYWLAVQHWNDADKSKRYKIPTTDMPKAQAIE